MRTFALLGGDEGVDEVEMGAVVGPQDVSRAWRLQQEAMAEVRVATIGENQRPSAALHARVVLRLTHEVIGGAGDEPFGVRLDPRVTE